MKMNLKRTLIARRRVCTCASRGPLAHFIYFVWRAAQGSGTRLAFCAHPAALEPDGLDLESAGAAGRNGSGGCIGAPSRRFAGCTGLRADAPAVLTALRHAHAVLCCDFVQRVLALTWFCKQHSFLHRTRPVVLKWHPLE